MTSNTWLSALKEKIEEENINIHNTDDDYREGEREDVWAGDDRNGKAGEFFTECVPEEPTKPTKAPLHPSKNTESLDQRAYETYKRSEGAISSSTDVLSIAREVLPPLKEEDRVDLQELLQANAPPDRGRDPLTKHDTDKAHFFHAPADCGCDVCMPLPKPARRRDGRTYRGERA